MPLDTLPCRRVRARSLSLPCNVVPPLLRSHNGIKGIFTQIVMPASRWAAIIGSHPAQRRLGYAVISHAVTALHTQSTPAQHKTQCKDTLHAHGTHIQPVGAGQGTTVCRIHPPCSTHAPRTHAAISLPRSNITHTQSGHVMLMHSAIVAFILVPCLSPCS
jgi:hypothetical protein